MLDIINHYSQEELFYLERNNPTPEGTLIVDFIKNNLSSNARIKYFDDTYTRSKFTEHFLERIIKATPEEFVFSQEILSAILDIISTENISIQLARSTLVDAISLHRTVTSLYPTTSKPHICEFGETSGLLSAMHLLQGGETSLVCFSKQSFTNQNLLLSALVQNKSNFPGSTQIPWWEWYAINNSKYADVIVTNEILLQLPSSLVHITFESFYKALKQSISPHVRMLICYLTTTKEYFAWHAIWEVARAVGFTVVEFTPCQVLLLPDFALEKAETVYRNLRHNLIHENDLIITPDQFENLFLALESI